uniref:RNase H type-1 domain-containing protein n=1 Tax=Quercus lobata TaxID=97700 RepID=A0A7N2MMH2_QUELO
MRWAVCMSIGKDFGSIVLEGDSLICYQALCLSDSTVPWRIRNIVQDIFLMVSRSQNVSFSGVSRVANGAAHCFVKWSLSYNFVGSIGVGSCPPCLEAALLRRTLVLLLCLSFLFYL